MATLAFPEYIRWDLSACLYQISQQSHQSAPTNDHIMFIGIIAPLHPHSFFLNDGERHSSFVQQSYAHPLDAFVLCNTMFLIIL